MYECRQGDSGPFTSCEAETDICPVLASGIDSQLEYRVDTSYEYYLNNWYVQMDLVCTSKVLINSMISLHYIAFGVAGLLLFSMPDRLGRKPTMLINFGLHLVAYYLLVFVPTYIARLAGFLLYGLCQLKNSVSYIYAAELVPSRQSSTVNVSLTSFDSATMAVVCLYFLFISRDWFPLIFLMLMLSTLSFLVVAFVLPESPIWLLHQGRVTEAIQTFNYIGRVNGVNR